MTKKNPSLGEGNQKKRKQRERSIDHITEGEATVVGQRRMICNLLRNLGLTLVEPVDIMGTRRGVGGRGWLIKIGKEVDIQEEGRKQ